MNRKRGLGRGLDALLGSASSTGVGQAAEVAATVAVDAGNEGATLRMLPVDLIQRGRYQPRLQMAQDALEELAASIRVQGVVQPVVVRPIANGARYELIAGERRWRAAQLAGLAEIPAVVRSLADRDVMAVALIENIQREQLNPLEEALALQRLIGEFGMTHQAVAEAVGRSRAAVSNLLRLLELGPRVRELLEAGQLDMGHARALLALTGDVQAQAAEKVVKEGLSVRATERLVRTLTAAKTAVSPVSPVRKDPNVASLEGELSDKLGAMVAIESGRNGGGRLVISYSSLEELDGILRHIR